MKISIIAFTGVKSENFGFIKPIVDSDEVDLVRVFGEGELEYHPKVKYYKDQAQKNIWIKLIKRLMAAIRCSKDSDIIIGIYEIPHGFLAMLTGLILRKPTVLCIIGNPAYKELRKGFRLALIKLMIRIMDFTTVTGSKSKDYLFKIGMDEQKIKILPNSVDTSIIKDYSFPRVYDIISLGRISPEKQLFNLVEIVCRLKTEFPKIRVGIAGNGPDKVKLHDSILKNELTTNVDLMGYIENKIEFYNQGRVFVLTSSTEGLPRTVVESMACGTPCVVSNVGDIEDIVHDSNDGFVINHYTDLDDYVGKISSLLSNDELRLSYSNKGKEFVQQNFSFSASTSFWEGIFYQLKRR
jgi:glycosyltransferase involved in cell wall biosynthesis